MERIRDEFYMNGLNVFRARGFVLRRRYGVPLRTLTRSTDQS